jgi:hypothetical protein
MAQTRHHRCFAPETFCGDGVAGGALYLDNNIAVVNTV